LAIQNFLSGGFYGKLGNVVGQRWHNKRIIRAHVIPHNPRTPAQQAHRGMFALATALAQEAYNINKGSDEWDTTEMPQFSQMVKVAYHRLKAGATPASALPLHPDGVQVSITLTAPNVSWSNWSTKATITDTSYTFPVTRNMAIIVFCYNEVIQQWYSFQDTITINAGQQFRYEFMSNNTYSLPAGSSITAVSTDDNQHSGDSIQLTDFALTQTRKASIELNITYPAPVLDRPNEEIRWTITNAIIDDAYGLFVDVKFYNSAQNKWIVDQAEADVIGTNTPIFRMIIDNYCTFPVGSYIDGIEFVGTSIGAEISYYLQRTNFSVS